MLQPNHVISLFFGFAHVIYSSFPVVSALFPETGFNYGGPYGHSISDKFSVGVKYIT
jgi:hypothetical protein